MTLTSRTALALFLASAAATAATAQSNGLRTVASTLAVMKTMTVPLSDAVFQAAGEPPKDDAGWATLADQAAMLAESANLLMVGDRVRDRNDWLRLARGQFEASERAMKAAVAKNAAALSTASDELYETCAACHTKYPSAPKAP